MNKEYIDRQSIYDRVKTHTNPYGKPTLDYESGLKVLNMIKTELAAEVAEVTYCKDCIHKEFCNQYVLISGDEAELAFCSYGSRGQYEKAYCD